MNNRRFLSCLASGGILCAILAPLTSIAQSEAATIPVQPVESISESLRPAQSASQVAAPTASEEETERKRLLDMPKLKVSFANTPLRTLVRWLAEQCSMNYVDLPSGQTGEQIVNLNVVKRPIDVLDMLAEDYGLGMTYKNGVWHFYQLNIHELIARTYQLYNNTEEYEATGGAGTNSAQTETTSNDRNNPNASNNSSGSGRSTIRIKSDASKKLVDAIVQYLGADTTGTGATFLQSAGVGTFFPIPKPDLVSAQTQTSTLDAGAKNSTTSKGKVYFNSDTNQLYVLATRQQHEYIEGLIETVDKAPKQIAIETSFVETSRDVSRVFGIDWSGSATPTLTASKLNTSVDLNNLSGTRWPSSGILSASDLQVGLNALASDSASTAVQYPRMVTLSNRQVDIDSTVTRKVLSATTSTSAGSAISGTQTIQSVQDEKVGTIVSILPKALPSPDGDNILLNIEVEVSAFSGTTVIQGVTYPNKSKRRFSYQVIVRSGYTLAIGGLEQTIDTTAVSKIPGLGDVPFFGMLFSNKKPARSNSSLMMLVTPTVMNGYTGGLPAHPISTTPRVGNTARRVFQGSAEETLSDVRASLSSFQREIEYVRALAFQKRGTEADVTKADLLLNELDLMALKVREKSRGSEEDRELMVAIESYRNVLKRARKDLSQSLGLKIF
jgi:hypothetical protein